MDATNILIAAADCIEQRGTQRDQPDGERSMRRAVDAFNAITGCDITERDGWMFMAVLKMARAQGKTTIADDYVDGAAYFALAGESVLNQVIPPT